jgi:EAL domain-containing protein (putative c-di-GMP-specific phosphodiesterase class I)
LLKIIFVIFFINIYCFHIIDCVINDMRVKQENGVRVVPVSVNVSLRDLDQFDLVGELLRRADAVGVPHELVRVEFTESVAMANSNQFMRTVAALRAAGMPLRSFIKNPRKQPRSFRAKRARLPFGRT